MTNLFWEYKKHYISNQASILDKVDSGMEKVIELLNTNQYLATYSCCQGHDRAGAISDYYIGFVSSSQGLPFLMSLYASLSAEYSYPNGVYLRFIKKQSDIIKGTTVDTVSLHVAQYRDKSPTPEEINEHIINFINAYRNVIEQGFALPNNW